MATKKALILVADDDPRILRLVKRNLEMEGYQTLTAYDGQQTLEQIEAKEPSVVLLDINMPKLNGFEVCERVREFSNVPIIIITAREQEQDLVRGLDLGADDYLTKPFGIEELLARVRAVLRRSQWDTASPEQELHHNRHKMAVGNLMIDFAQHSVAADGRVIELTPIEFRLLAYLARNVGHVVTPDLLLEQAWGEEYAYERHLLIVNINRLRRKLERDPAHPVYILTRKGVGYFMPSQPAAAAAPTRAPVWTEGNTPGATWLPTSGSVAQAGEPAAAPRSEGAATRRMARETDGKGQRY